MAATKKFSSIFFVLIVAAGLLLILAAPQTGIALSGAVAEISIPSSAGITAAEEEEMLWDGVILFADHTDSTHRASASNNLTLIEDLTFRISQIQNRLTGPNGPVILCAVAVLKSGVVQYRIFDIASGLTFFYHDNTWSSVFPGKTPLEFLNGNPRGALDYQAYDPSSGEDALRTCLSILSNAPPAGSVK